MFFKKSKPAEAANAPAVTSTQPSAVPSENVSVSDIEQEKEKQRSTTAAESRSINSGTVETTGLDEAKALDRTDDEAEIEYPTGTKLAFITFALCISVFLMALV